MFYWLIHGGDQIINSYLYIDWKNSNYGNYGEFNDDTNVFLMGVNINTTLDVYFYNREFK